MNFDNWLNNLETFAEALNPSHKRNKSSICIIKSAEDLNRFKKGEDLILNKVCMQIEDTDTKYSIRDLYLKDSVIIGQENLSMSGKIYIDIPVVNDQWSIIGCPVKGLVLGDFFIPVNETSFPEKPKKINQEVGTYAEDRAVCKIYQSFYSSKTSNTWNTKSSVTDKIGSTGFGIGIDYSAHAGEKNYIRLCKSDDFYRYYQYNNWVNQSESTITRDSDYGQPMYKFDTQKGGCEFTLTNTMASNTFVFGNPTLGCIDMEKFVKRNSNVLEEKYYIHTPSESSLNNISVESENTRNILNVGEGCLIKSKTTGTSLKVIVTPDMIVFNK